MKTSTPFNVTVIPATLNVTPSLSGMPSCGKKKVAAYARVSTDDEEQKTSYLNQTSYYADYIKSNPNWTFVGVYTDEGVTGTNTKKREGFRTMIADAMAGKIDLIITKSVSRFARNTVDSLVTIRQLKDRGIEVYFEKENIYTLDSKGEFLLTIMSSIAQEESRSISENVTWGKRKSFKDGKVSLPYKHFLGLKKGSDGRPEIEESQAQIVRQIYRMFLLGQAPLSIATYLTNQGIPTPSGKRKWSPQSIVSILTNEKYKGDAVLQKTFTVDYLTHKTKINEGEVPQYYVKNSHEAIIDPQIFDIVQHEVKFWRANKQYMAAKYPFSSRLRCAICGEYFVSRVLHANSKYKKRVWQCKSRSKKNAHCSSTSFDSQELEQAFLSAINQMISNRDNLISIIQEFAHEEYPVETVEKDMTALNEEIQLLYNMLKALIEENSQSLSDQNDYAQSYERYASRFEALKKEREQTAAKLSDLKANRMKVERFISQLKVQEKTITKFDEELWYSTADWMEITEEQDINVVFKGGYVIRIPMPQKHPRK